MKKTALVVIIAVALLGIFGLWANGTSSSKNKSSVSSGVNQTTAAVNSSAVNPTSSSTDGASSQGYKNGTYSSSSETPYGTVGISVIIANGQISDIKFTNLPNDHRESVQISNYSAPILRDNAIKAQSAKIDFVSGATSTSYGFAESLQAALDQAAKS